MGPINYQTPQVDLSRSIMSGLQTGAGFADLLQQRQQAAQMQQAQAAQQQALAQAHADYQANPNAVTAARLMQMDPKQREAVQLTLGQFTTERREAEVGFGQKVLFALRSGNPDIAAQTLEQRIEAMKAAGEDTAEEEQYLAAVKADPAQAQRTGELWLAAAMGPEKYIESIGKMDEQRRLRDRAPAEQRTAEAGAVKAEAEAVTAGVTADFAERNALQELEQRGWDIKRLQASVQSEQANTRLRVLQAEAEKELNPLRRRELEAKIGEAQSARDSRAREKAATVERGTAVIDRALSQIARIKELKKAVPDVTGALEGQPLYPNVLAATASRLGPVGLFTSSPQDRADLLAEIEGLGDQQFSIGVESLRGLGAASNVETQAAKMAQANVRRTMRSERFLDNMLDYERRLLSLRDAVVKESGMPAPRVDVPEARGKDGSRPPLDSFIRP